MSKTVQRRPRKYPSVKKHGLSAFLLLALIGLSGFTWIKMFGNKPQIARTGPEFTLPKAKIPETINISQDLPDLLAPDNIPLDVNPTESVNMLGGPDTEKPVVIAGNGGGQSGPRTIMINGKPLGGGVVSGPLVRAPIQGLSRMSPFGKVPHIASDGRSAFTAYAKPFTPDSNIQYVSIVIGGLGLDPTVTRRAINDLPGSITLSFALESPGLQLWINQARAKGHEVLIELPMDSSASAAGNHTLTSTKTASQNIKDLDFLLSRAQGYFAVTNYGGTNLISNQTFLTPVLTHIKNAGLGFVYDGEVKDTKITEIGGRIDLPTVSASAYLDDKAQDKKSVQRAIDSLRSQAGNSIPIGMGFSYEGTVDGVKDWLAAKPGNIGVAPVSYVTENP